MNYWFGVGLLFAAVGVLYYAMGKAARRRVDRLEGLAGAAVGIGYVFPVLGAVFMVVGLVEMAR